MELCPACGHLLDEHFRSIEGNNVCMHVEAGTTSRGVIGLSYLIRCDCLNGTSAKAVFNDPEVDKQTKLTRMIKRVLGEFST